MNFPTLKVENLRKILSPEIEITAEFSVAPGERVALLGRSGSGKTSVLKMIAGVISPDDGKIFYNEKEITNLKPEKRKIGFVFQDQALFPTMNVLENVCFGLRMQGVSKRDREQAGRSWLKKLGLAERTNSNIQILSGGERQRIAFLRALITKPNLFLLDEPFTSLDAQMRDFMRAELLRLHEEWRAPLIFVTHDTADTALLATRRIELLETRNLRHWGQGD